MPVRGGDKFPELLRGLTKRLNKPGTVRVGFLEKAKYPNGTPVAMVAAIQNFGAPARNIPPRPFFSNMVETKGKQWPAAMKNLLKTTGDIEKTLKQTGEGVVGQLRQSIQETNSPPLSQRTIDRKGSSKPLIDTGHMLASADYEVKLK